MTDAIHRSYGGVWEMLQLSGAAVDFAEPIETRREAGEVAALLRYEAGVALQYVRSL